MNKRTILARELRRLANQVECALTEQHDAEIGIRLAELDAQWKRDNLGHPDPLQACRDLPVNNK